MDNVSTKKLSTKADGSLENDSGFDIITLKLVITISAVLCVISAVIFDKTKELGGLQLPIYGFGVVAAVAIYLGVSKKLTVKNILLLILAAGFVLRLNYVLITSVTARVRQHDVFAFGSGKGHSGYIEHFYNNGFTLPDFNPVTKAQFYHPPLNHFLSALWVRLLTTFGMEYSRAIASIGFLTLFYSMCSLIISERILDKLHLKGLGKILAFAVIAFHPTSILLSSSINNDNIALMFTLLAVYATLNWYEKPTVKNILLIALAVGLGMSAKISVGLIAPPIALVFIVNLIYGKKSMAEKMKQYVAFGCLCLPLGLWYPLRNLIKYDVPLNYVPLLSPTSDQYIGNYSAYERLLDYSYKPFDNVFLNRVTTGSDYFEYNPFVAIIKTSMFGEYDFTKYYAAITPFCRVLLWLNVIMIAISLIATVYCIIKGHGFMDNIIKCFLMLYQVLLYCFYMKFVFDFPHNCSMDFRYLTITLVLGSIFIAIMLEELKTAFPKNKIVSIIRGSVTVVTTLFCIMSSLVYVLLGVGS